MFQIYLIVFFGVAVLFLVAAMILTPRLLDEPRLSRGLVKTMHDRHPEILLFGDSVIRASGMKYCDTGSKTVDDLLVEGLPSTSLGTATFTASNPVLFNDLLSIALNHPHPPGLFIVPINLRSFSEEWYTRPSYNRYLDRALIRLRYGDGGLFDYFRILKYRYTNALESEMESWRNQTVAYPDIVLGPRRTLHGNSMEIPSGLECVPHMKEKYRDVLRTKYSYHYLYRLTLNHEVMQALEAMIRRVQSKNLQILVYITPINFQDGERFVGPEFRRIVLGNRDVIKKRMQEMGVVLLDLMDQLPPERFIDQFAVCEHLDESGRRFIATQLIDALRLSPFNRE